MTHIPRKHFELGESCPGGFNMKSYRRVEVGILSCLNKVYICNSPTSVINKDTIKVALLATIQICCEIYFLPQKFLSGTR